MNRVLLDFGATKVAVYRAKSGLMFEVDLRAHSQVDAFYTRVYEPESVAVVLELYDASGVFLDVGANVGFYAVSVADQLRRQSAGGKVVCFEPFPPNVHSLKGNLQRNQLSPYCDIIEYGLSNSAQRLELVLREDFQSGAASGNASIATSESLDAGFDHTTIELVALDEVWGAHGRGLPPIDFVKVDIEGHEDCFFQGAKGIFEQHRPTALVEVNEAYLRAKGAHFDQTLLPYLPPRFRLYRHAEGRWTGIPNFAACSDFENVLLIPEERLSRPTYRKALRLD